MGLLSDFASFKNDLTTSIDELKESVAAPVQEVYATIDEAVSQTEDSDGDSSSSSQ